MNAFPKRLPAAFLFLLPLAFAGCQAPQNNVTPPTENAANTLPTPASTRKSSPALTIKKKVALFVPDDNGKLKRGEVTEEFAYKENNAAEFHRTETERLIELLIKKSPRDFPKNAKLIGRPTLSQDGKILILNFNRAFSDANFWQGATQTRATLYAITNTVLPEVIEGSGGGSVGDIAPEKVRFLVEGKPIQALGDFDLSDPLPPDMTMVAKP